MNLPHLLIWEEEGERGEDEFTFDSIRIEPRRRAGGGSREESGRRGEERSSSAPCLRWRARRRRRARGGEGRGGEAKRGEAAGKQRERGGKGRGWDAYGYFGHFLISLFPFFFLCVYYAIMMMEYMAPSYESGLCISIFIADVSHRYYVSFYGTEEYIQNFFHAFILRAILNF